MDKIKLFFKSNQQIVVLVIGYVLVASLAFGLGRFSAFKYEIPEIRVEQAFSAPSNYNPNISGTQTESVSNPAPAAPKVAGNCEGKIKGSSSMIYHLPAGAFYTKTTKPTRCFDSEAEAKAAGFRKSSR